MPKKRKIQVVDNGLQDQDAKSCKSNPDPQAVSARTMLRLIRGRRRGSRRVHLPTVRAVDKHSLLSAGSKASDHLEGKLVNKRPSVDTGTALNLSLLDNDDVGLDEDSTKTKSSTSLGKDTTNLLVDWNPSQPSENHIIYEAFNAHSFLTSVFLKSNKFPVPIILKNQLYNVVNDRTTVDREVAELCQRGVFRVLRARQ